MVDLTEFSRRCPGPNPLSFRVSYDGAIVIERWAPGAGVFLGVVGAVISFFIFHSIFVIAGMLAFTALACWFAHERMEIRVGALDIGVALGAVMIRRMSKPHGSIEAVKSVRTPLNTYAIEFTYAANLPKGEALPRYFGCGRRLAQAQWLLPLLEAWLEDPYQLTAVGLIPSSATPGSGADLAHGVMRDLGGEPPPGAKKSDWDRIPFFFRSAFGSLAFAAAIVGAALSAYGMGAWIPPWQSPARQLALLDTRVTADAFDVQWVVDSPDGQGAPGDFSLKDVRVHPELRFDYRDAAGKGHALLLQGPPQRLNDLDNVGARLLAYRERLARNFPMPSFALAVPPVVRQHYQRNPAQPPAAVNRYRSNDTHGKQDSWELQDFGALLDTPVWTQALSWMGPRTLPVIRYAREHPQDALPEAAEALAQLNTNDLWLYPWLLPLGMALSFAVGFVMTFRRRLMWRLVAGLALAASAPFSLVTVRDFAARWPTSEIASTVVYIADDAIFADPSRSPLRLLPVSAPTKQTRLDFSLSNTCAPEVFAALLPLPRPAQDFNRLAAAKAAVEAALIARIVGLSDDALSVYLQQFLRADIKDVQGYKYDLSSMSEAFRRIAADPKRPAELRKLAGDMQFAR